MNYKNGGLFFAFFVLVYYFSKNSIFRMFKSAVSQAVDFLLREPLRESGQEEGKEIAEEK